MDFKGRIHQDTNFDVKGFDGEVVEELLGRVMDGDPDNWPIIIYLKTTNRLWQKYFLDAYLGFWEEYDFDCEDDERVINYGHSFSIKGQIIHSIKCKEGKIILEFKSGDHFILRLVNPKEDDTTSEVIFVQRNF